MTEPDLFDSREFYIDGQWVAPTTTNDALVIDPSTEAACAVISLGTATDADLAVAAAKAALVDWSATQLEDRLGPLTRLLELYDDNADSLARSISVEMGAPITFARTSQVSAGRDHIDATIKALRSFRFEHPLDSTAPEEMIRYEPIGVCALITPWNWPMNQLTLKVIPALGVGCTVVLKPPREAPLSSSLFAELVDEASFPPGVFNLVNGSGTEIGAHLTQHHDVDMVSFTGSTTAGISITKAAAETVKRVTLELGGKGANIIFADADDDAVRRGVEQCFDNTGQSCNAPTRMLVQRDRYDAAVATAARVANATEVGMASVEGNHLGPVVSRQQWDQIQQLIISAIDEGATLVAGGPGRPDGHDTGFFVKPTVFADVSPAMTIAREEAFGPVLAITLFDSETEAVRIANDTVYGLGNYVQTTDARRARRVARKLRSGMVEINGSVQSSAAPFGGYRQSGNGREGGTWGIEEFLDVKVVSGWPAT